MTRRLSQPYLLLLCSFVTALPALGHAQRHRRSYSHGSYNQPGWYENGRMLAPDETIPSFAGDNRFTFCRVYYRDGYGLARNCMIDFYESDVNFSLRLSELTTIEVNRSPRGAIRHVVAELTDPKIFDFPYLYIIEVGQLHFSEDEIEGLRNYLMQGGFMHVDDFWGEAEWANWEYEIGRVFPPDQFPIRDIPLSHEIFHIVFEIKEIPQIPAIGIWEMYGVTWEREDAKEPHIRGIFDENGRLMIVMTHNSDLGDGWEREADSPDYFREFSAKRAYPLGINLVVYAMTH